jgi:hypothetical protein
MPSEARVAAKNPADLSAVIFFVAQCLCEITAFKRTDGEGLSVLGGGRATFPYGMKIFATVVFTWG